MTATADDVTVAPLVPASGRGARHHHAALHIRHHRGQWILLLHSASHRGAVEVARKVRTGERSWSPAGAYTSRVDGCHVWVRYDGPPVTAAPSTERPAHRGRAVLQLVGGPADPADATPVDQDRDDVRHVAQQLRAGVPAADVAEQLGLTVAELADLALRCGRPHLAARLLTGATA